MTFSNPSPDEIRRILEQAGNIAVVGCSEKPERSSHMVAAALQARGYRIIPVNPNAKGKTILGETCYASLSEIPEPVDIVDVFRKSEHVLPIAEEAVKIGAKVFWLQQGIINQEAADVAKAGGLTVIMDSCIKVQDALLQPKRS